MKVRPSARACATRMLFLLSIQASLSACISIPPAISLSSASPSGEHMERGAWLGVVDIQDPTLTDRARACSAMTLELQRYVGETGMFSRVGILPGEYRPGDVALKFSFDRFRQTRRPHPAYFPAAMFTLTLYIWVGGAIYLDETDLRGSLRIEGSDGRTLVTAEASRIESRAIGLWSTEYALPSGIETRTTLIRELLDRAVGQLESTKGDEHGE